MRIAGSRIIAAPLTIVTDTLQNGRKLIQSVPDLQMNAPLDAQQQRITVTVSSGPLQGKYETAVAITHPETAVFQFTFDGHGAKGIFQGNGRLQLAAQDEQTSLYYEGDIDVTDQLAALPPRLLQANIHAIIRRTLDGVERILWPDQWAEEPEKAPPQPWAKTAVPAGLFLLAALFLIRFINKRQQSTQAAT